MVFKEIKYTYIFILVYKLISFVMACTSCVSKQLIPTYSIPSQLHLNYTIQIKSIIRKNKNKGKLILINIFEIYIFHS